MDNSEWRYQVSGKPSGIFKDALQQLVSGGNKADGLCREQQKDLARRIYCRIESPGLEEPFIHTRNI